MKASLGNPIKAWLGFASFAATRPPRGPSMSAATRASEIRWVAAHPTLNLSWQLGDDAHARTAEPLGVTYDETAALAAPVGGEGGYQPMDEGGQLTRAFLRPCAFVLFVRDSFLPRFPRRQCRLESSCSSSEKWR